MNLLQLLFGCRCWRFTFPITPPRGSTRTAAMSVTGTYVVCLDCGAEYPYDWSTMRRLEMPRATRIEAQILPLIKADER
jgi:hypothetical protein